MDTGPTDPATRPRGRPRKLSWGVATRRPHATNLPAGVLEEFWRHYRFIWFYYSVAYCGDSSCTGSEVSMLLCGERLIQVQLITYLSVPN